MNAVIYARYSSHAQREESIEQQVAVCCEYCARRGLDVLRVYADAARSGRSTEGRDQFQKMLADARAGEFGAVVVYKLDRFARDRYDSVLNKKRLRDCGVSVLSAMENIPDGPEGRLMESVIEGVAEWYSADLSQKTLRGMPAIIDLETFRRAGLRRRATAAPNRCHEYPLAGRLFDHETGVAMTGYLGRSRGRDYLYYSANVGGKHHLIRREVLESAVVRAVTGAFKDAAFLEDVLDRIDALRDHVGDPEDVVDARATIRECRAEEKRLAHLRDGDYTPEVIVKMLRENEDRRRAAEDVVKRAKRDAATREEVRAFLLNMKDAATPAEIIAHMVHRVDVLRDEGAVVVTLPISPYEKRPNPAETGFSRVHGWLPALNLGAKGLAWRVTPSAVLIFARVA